MLTNNSLKLYESVVLQKIESNNSFALYSKFRALKTELVRSYKSAENCHYFNMDILDMNDFGKSLYLSTMGELEELPSKNDFELFGYAIEKISSQKKVLIFDSFQYMKNVFVLHPEFGDELKKLVVDNKMQVIFITSELDSVNVFLDDKYIIHVNRAEYAATKEYFVGELDYRGYTVNDVDLDYLISISQRIQYYVVSLLKELTKDATFSNSKTVLTRKNILDAINSIYEQEKLNIAFLLQKSNTRNMSLAVLMYLSVNSNPYDLLEYYDVTKPYIAATIKFLIENNILYVEKTGKKVEDRYLFINPVMKFNLSLRTDLERLIEEQKKNEKIINVNYNNS